MSTRRLLAILLVAVLSPPVIADGLIFARSKQEFPEAMLTLQESIRAHGYTISRVQRVDVGLTKMGYATDRYRIVFFAKLDEMRILTDQHPELVPYLPTSISIFAEGRQTLLVAVDPARYKSFLANQNSAILLDRCASDIRSILDDVSRAE